MAIPGKLGAIYRTTGAAIAMTTEAMTADTANQKFYITNRAKAYWDDTQAVTVRKGGVIQTTGFTIEHAGGYIKPDVYNAADVWTVTGYYFATAQCATFFNWKLNVDIDTKEVTTFASNGWKEFTPTLKGFSVASEGYWADGTFIGLLGSRIIAAFYVDSTTNKKYEGYIILKKNSIENATDDVVKENIEFEGTGQLFYHEN